MSPDHVFFAWLIIAFFILCLPPVSRAVFGKKGRRITFPLVGAVILAGVIYWWPFQIFMAHRAYDRYAQEKGITREIADRDYVRDYIATGYTYISIEYKDQPGVLYKYVSDVDGKAFWPESIKDKDEPERDVSGDN